MEKQDQEKEPKLRFNKITLFIVYVIAILVIIAIIYITIVRYMLINKAINAGQNITALTLASPELSSL
jgi:uncharacterized BrkB/YihY/UPF0761 family membrane protein